MAPSSTRRSRSAFRPWIIGLMVIGFLGIVISVYQTVNMGEARVSAAKEAINHPEQLADTLQLEDSLLLMPVPQDTMPAARDTSTAGNVSSSRTEPAEDGPAASRTITSPPTVDAPTPTEPRMVGIIAGNYIMGCDTNLANNNCPDDEHPPHPVRVERFHMSQYEVTNAEYAVFLNANAQSKDIAKWIKLNESNNRERCRISLIDGKFRVEKGYENYPVIYVTWYGAVAYAEWLSKSTGKRYRLPTEAEWEFVARNGGKGGVYAGGDDAGAVAWYRRNAGGRTHPVGERRPVMGIYDLNGNVWEWTADCWHDNYQGAPATSQPAWTEGGNCRYRVMRGGSWFSEADILRVTYRDSYLASEGTSDCGFRLVYD